MVRLRPNVLSSIISTSCLPLVVCARQVGRAAASQHPRTLRTSEHIDYGEQVTVDGDLRHGQPDAVIRISDDVKVVIDTKMPMDSYLTAHEAADDETRRRNWVCVQGGGRAWKHKSSNATCGRPLVRPDPWSRVLMRELEWRGSVSRAV